MNMNNLLEKQLRETMTPLVAAMLHALITTKDLDKLPAPQFAAALGSLVLTARNIATTILQISAAAPSEKLASDTELLDAAADMRIVDAIGGIDIDEATLNALSAKNGGGPPDDDEDAWRLEWRNQFRIALREAVQKSQSSQRKE